MMFNQSSTFASTFSASSPAQEKEEVYERDPIELHMDDVKTDVPVGFEVEPMDLVRATTRIQAAYRGYAVRRCKPMLALRKIADVRVKFRRLQVLASDPAYMESLCVDFMESRKMAEGIMALLLQLDAIQGVHPVVREIRKSATREVIQFQEIVDAVIVAAAATRRSESTNPILGTESISMEPTLEPIRSVEGSPRAPALNASLSRVFSLDNNVFPEQSYIAKTPNANSGGVKALKRSSSVASMRPEDSPIVIPVRMSRSASGRSPLLGRSISEVQKKLSSQSPLLGRSISEVQRKPRVVTLGDTEDGSPLKAVPVMKACASEAEAMDPEGSAARIQSRYRGYLSRRSKPLKHLRNISDVKFKVRELNSLLADSICVERLRTDRMEQLKWTEGITALLLKLDSVQGVDQVVRDIRKSVTREVIQLQEKVDGIIHEGDGTPLKDKCTQLDINDSQGRPHLDAPGEECSVHLVSDGSHNNAANFEEEEISTLRGLTDSKVVEDAGGGTLATNFEKDREMDRTATHAMNLYEYQEQPDNAVFSGTDDLQGTAQQDCLLWHDKFVEPRDGTGTISGHRHQADLQQGATQSSARDCDASSPSSKEQHKTDQISPSRQGDLELSESSQRVVSDEQDFESLSFADRSGKDTCSTTTDDSIQQVETSRKQYDPISRSPPTPTYPTAVNNSENPGYLENREEHLLPPQQNAQSLHFMCSISHEDTRMNQGIFGTLSKSIAAGMKSCGDASEVEADKGASEVLSTRFEITTPARYVTTRASDLGGHEDPSIDQECLRHTTTEVFTKVQAPQREPSGLVAAAEKSLTDCSVVKKTEDLDISLVGHLTDENFKLKNLLEEVLQYAELQASKLISLKERFDELEGEASQSREREDAGAWKRPKGNRWRR